MSHPRRGGRLNAAQAVVALICLASCDTATHHQVVGDTTLLRQAHLGNEYPAGLGSGRLTVKGGCVAMDGSERGIAFIVWTPQVELNDAGNGELEVVAPDGTRAEIGQEIRIGGGYGDLQAADLWVGDAIPQSCRSQSDAYFVEAPGAIEAT